MRIPEEREFCFSLLTFSRTVIPIFLFMVLSFYVMRLSIGSVVIVLVAQKGSVWICRFFVENTIRRRRMEIFYKTGGLNLHFLKTRIYLCYLNNNDQMGRPFLKYFDKKKKSIKLFMGLLVGENMLF